MLNNAPIYSQPCPRIALAFWGDCLLSSASSLKCATINAFADITGKGRLKKSKEIGFYLLLLPLPIGLLQLPSSGPVV